MRIIGVIDVRDGQAVHARGGVRAAYAPVDVAAGVNIAGNAVALARVYVEQLGVRELYVADLDAIARGTGAMNAALLRDVVSIGVPVMVDAGVTTPRDARIVLDAGAARVIVGLETLSDFDALAGICADVGGERVVFSIDLRDGALLASPEVLAVAGTVADVATRAAVAGVGAAIVLDVARVGSGAGIDLALMRSVRVSLPHAELFAGGGVRGKDDLTALADAGCDGALVATALHRGSIHV